MKSIVGPLAAAVVLALAGAVFWTAGQTETRLAEVHKQLATLRYADASSEGGRFEDSLGVERRNHLLSSGYHAFTRWRRRAEPGEVAGATGAGGLVRAPSSSRARRSWHHAISATSS